MQAFFQQLPLIQFILFCVALLSLVIHLLYYLSTYTKLAMHKPSEEKKEHFPISIIVCAKNESANLRKFLTSILLQDYNKFEVIVVNDGSWDDTAAVLEDYEKEYKHLKIVTLPDQDKYRHGKKLALTLGIKAAQFEHLIFTDADCAAVSNQWLKLMAAGFSGATEVLIGYGGFYKAKGFLNKLIRWDAFMIACNYLSRALGGKAYMGVGRNMGYQKSLYFKSKGFKNHYHIYSGDDDLFVNENATTTNTAVVVHPAAFTQTNAKSTLAAWLTQKHRHNTTGRLYKMRDQLFLFWQPFSQFMFITSLITLLILRFDYRIMLSLYAIKLIIQFPIIYMCSKKLNEKDLSWFFPILELIHLAFQPFFLTINLFSKPKAWK
ncbi:MAG: hypothetical protein RIQ89_1797 [Bacteroidota bacterium]|jgi:glycosyltransferase involved in cell wall biosynthesis